MLSRCASAGPGPLTLAYRLGLLGSRRLTHTLSRLNGTEAQQSAPGHPRRLQREVSLAPPVAQRTNATLRAGKHGGEAVVASTGAGTGAGTSAGTRSGAGTTTKADTDTTAGTGQQPRQEGKLDGKRKPPKRQRMPKGTATRSAIQGSSSPKSSTTTPRPPKPTPIPPDTAIQEQPTLQAPTLRRITEKTEKLSTPEPTTPMRTTPGRTTSDPTTPDSAKSIPKTRKHRPPKSATPPAKADTKDTIECVTVSSPPIGKKHNHRPLAGKGGSHASGLKSALGQSATESANLTQESGRTRGPYRTQDTYRTRRPKRMRGLYRREDSNILQDPIHTTEPSPPHDTERTRNSSLPSGGYPSLKTRRSHGPEGTRAPTRSRHLHPTQNATRTPDLRPNQRTSRASALARTAELKRGSEADLVLEVNHTRNPEHAADADYLSDADASFGQTSLNHPAKKPIKQWRTRRERKQGLQGVADADEPPTIALPPPLDDPFTHGVLEKFRLSLELSAEANRDATFANSVKAFGELRACSALSLLGTDDYIRISALIASCFIRITPPNMRWFVAKRSLQFGLALEMALYAAAHDQWRGLYNMTTALLASGLPSEIPGLYVRCAELMLAGQGRTMEDLHHMDRWRRITSRLDSPTLAPLAMVTIAAHTKLNTFDSSAVWPLLGGNLHRKEMRIRAFPALIKLLPDELRTRFEENVHKLFICIAVYHGSALVDHLRSTATDQLHTTPKLYEEMLRASTGPDRVLVALDLDSRDTRPSMKQAVIHPQVWRGFMRCFDKLGRVDLIEAMIDEHLPERGITVSPRLLAWAMLYLSRIYYAKRHPPLVQAQARTKLLEIWERFEGIRLPEHDADLIRSLQLLALAKLGHDELLISAYKSAKHGTLKFTIGNHTLSAIVTTFVRKSWFDAALDVLRSALGGTHPGLAVPNEQNFSDFIIHLAGNRIPVAAKRLIVEELLALLPESQTLLAAAWARTLAIMVGAGAALDDQWSLLEKRLRRPGDPYYMFSWQDALLELVNRDELPDMPLELFEIVLRILGKLSHLPVIEFPRTRKLRVWSLAVYRAASSTMLSAAERGRVLDAIFELYGPCHVEGEMLEPYMRAIAGCLSVPNGEGLGQAKLRWGHLRSLGKTPQNIWNRMLRHLVGSDSDAVRFRSAAVDLVIDAWISKEVSPRNEFWPIAQAHGLIEAAGLKVSDRVWRQSRSHPRLANSDEVKTPLAAEIERATEDENAILVGEEAETVDEDEAADDEDEEEELESSSLILDDTEAEELEDGPESREDDEDYEDVREAMLAEKDEVTVPPTEAASVPSSGRAHELENLQRAAATDADARGPPLFREYLVKSEPKCAPPSPTLSDSALLDSLDDDPRFDLAAHREARLEQLKRAVGQVKALRESEYGRVVAYPEEKRLIERMAKEKYCLVHFYHPDFHRCRIMDKRLDELAPKHPHTLFLRASVVDVPFLVTKFTIQVLPCVMVFVDGRCVDRLIGFEELGDSDRFTLSMLEFRLKQSGALPDGQIALAQTLPAELLGSGAASGADRSDSEDEDEDVRIRRKDGKVRPRRGKVGIRNGIVGAGSDDD